MLQCALTSVAFCGKFCEKVSLFRSLLNTCDGKMMSQPKSNFPSTSERFEDLALAVGHRADGQVRMLRHLDRISMPSTLTFSLKRAFDFLAALLITLFISPVLLILVIVAVAQNDGPIFYAQRRIGRGGVVFRCWKFRTMYNGADKVLASLLAADERLRAEWTTTGKLRRDPRVTRVGRFLRATSLDELPQLWNVLCGDMSLVGPRPITEAELTGPYTVYHGRDAYLSVRPGITGLWQVSGRSDVSYEGRVSLDVTYVKTLSPFKDLQILFKTIGAVLLRDGAR